ncbi:hypothetical protein ICW40_16360 [Actinotalea ferrariae]|uniref:hypothetical protein n=1 Tax=Actinotalea ferrariae TaxID=1386098 RepID=UPI001C8C1267|nr:hypothetical protein [Actinotalea ferrariae]MBX9246368.1 hypothetical protein [Actinotalea ferrariae]
MTDTDSEVTLARTALGGPATVADPEILGAVRSGLLAVPVDKVELTVAPMVADASGLAVRRRQAG